MPLTPGTRLGPYEVLVPIGAGGMGEVYKARDTRLDRAVAIKVLPSNLSSNPELRARLDREARAISSLSHPNICTLYDIGHQEGHDFLVMEFLEGETLADRLKRGPLPIEEVLKISIEVAGALDKAHRRGMVHRDLKPANLFLTRDGATKILDFGLAKTTVDTDGGEAVTLSELPLTGPGAAVGTVAYMSPEQARGEPLDAGSDLFSFGVVLYEATTGCRPFLGATTAILFDAILNRRPKPMTELNPRTPEDVERIVTRLLAKSSASRYQSAQAVLEELRAAREGARRGLGSSGTLLHTTPSIAVLPFANLSADPEQEYFSDGLAEEILNALIQVSGLKVIARTSAFAFKGKNEDIRKIAETLGVTNVLEGSVRRAGGRIRVSAQLIHAADGTHLWSERYDRDLTDVFAIQDEIGQAISEALKLQLAPRAKTVNIVAYQNYLKGQYHFLRLTPESLAKAKEFFEQALASDPNYASAYSGLAVYYYTLATFGIKPAGEVAPLVISAAKKALGIDPADSEAHSMLASIAAMFDYDWKAAEQHFRKAMAAEPVPPMVRFRYAFYRLHPLGRVSEAMEQIRLGLDTDPLSMILHYSMVLSMQHAKQYREAIECARRAMEIDANYFLMWYAMGLAQLSAGFTPEAITSLKRVVELAPWWHMGVWSLAAAYCRAGDREHGQEWARKVADSQGHTLGASRYYAITGEVDAMFDALDGAYRQRDVFLLVLQHELFFDPYRADPRFQALLQRMDLT